jgi:hypothetical protein
LQDGQQAAKGSSVNLPGNESVYGIPRTGAQQSDFFLRRVIAVTPWRVEANANVKCA